MIGAAVVGSVGLFAAPAGAATSANLIKNGGAEAGSGGDGRFVGVPSWTSTSATAVRYGTPGFPTATGPGPASRGSNFFAGGYEDGTGANLHMLTQTISLKHYVGRIKQGHVTFTLSGYFGGYTTQDDTASLEIVWRGADGSYLSGWAVGYVHAADRNNVTGLLKRSLSKAVPSGARSADVTAAFVRHNGYYNDGYSDNLSLVLKGV